MKKKVLTLLILLTASTIIFSQKKVPVNIIMKEGGNILAQHFGQGECDGNDMYTGYILLKGKYMDLITEMKDYSTISKLELIGFTKEPASSVGNEKGKIVVYKKNGITVTLEEAELIISCMGNNEYYNQIKVQVLNPVTEKVVEKSIDVRDIKTIIFQ